MENPSDDYSSTMAIAAAIEDISSINDIGKDEDEPSIENKPCTSDSQLILDSIMSAKHDTNYSASLWPGGGGGGRKTNNKELLELEPVEFLAIPAPTESEALEIEHTGNRSSRTGKGISMSETTVSFGESSTPFFPADYTSSADSTTPSKKPHDSHRQVMRAKKASSKGESMPKALPQYVRKITDKESRSQRIYINYSPFSKTSSHLGVIQEEDEDNDN